MIALSVTDEIHKRFKGFLQFAFSKINLATNSPSRPASVAMMILLIGVMVIELYQDESRLKEVSNPEPQIEMTEVFEEKIPVNQIPVEEIPGE